jgi:hypothetical protein
MYNAQQKQSNNSNETVNVSKNMSRRSVSMSLSYDIILSVRLAYTSVKPVSRYDKLIIGRRELPFVVTFSRKNFSAVS